MSQSKYYNNLDLDLYTGMLYLVNGENSFGLAREDYHVGMLHTEFCNCLSNFEKYSVLEKRAIALAVMGTEFETEEMNNAVLDMAVNGNDVIARIAYVRSRFAIPEFRQKIIQLILNTKYKTIEDVVLTVLSIDPDNTFGSEALLIQLIEELKGNTDFIVANKSCFKLLLDWNEKSTMKVDLLVLLNTAIANVPDSDSAIVGELLWHGFLYKDVLRIAVTMRKYDKRYTRGYRKTEKAENNLKVELAQSFKAWSDSEKELIREFRTLDSRIFATKNYVWFHDNIEFRLPELQLNLKDKRSIFKKVECLTDLERCVLAIKNDLNRDQAGVLGIKFSEWSKYAQTLFDRYNYDGSLKPADSTFLLNSVEYKDLTDSPEDYKILAAMIEMNSLPTSEYTVDLANRILPYSQESYLSIMEFLYDSDELTHEQIQEYEELYYASDSAEYDYDAKLAFYDEKGSSSESGLGSRAIWQLLNETVEDKQQVYDVLKNTKIHQYDVEKFIRAGRVLTSLVKYEKFTTEKDEETTQMLNLASNTRFRDFTDLTLKQCYNGLNTAAKLQYAYNNMVYGQREVYENVMPNVMRDWVLTGSPIATMREKVSISSALGLTKDQEEEWLSKITKDMYDANSVTCMSLTIGRLDNELCVLASIGVINLEGEKTGGIELPVWVLDDTGIQKDVVVTGLAFGNPMSVQGLPEIYCDTKIQLTLRKVN